MSHRPVGIKGVAFSKAIELAKLAIAVVPGDNTD
jgi:hypothetical protein